jgi:type IV pilus assembly protein PilY1
MNAKWISRPLCLAFAAGEAMLCGTADPADLNLADAPLFVAGNVDPNIMFLIDDSGSMHNIVPDAPYDAATR